MKTKTKTTICALVLSTLSLFSKQNTNLRVQEQPTSTTGIYYALNYQGQHLLIPLRDIYKIKIMKNDSFAKWADNEKAWSQRLPRTIGLLEASLKYINQQPFDPYKLKEGQEAVLWDIDRDKRLMGRPIQGYGTRITEPELKAILKHNDGYDVQKEKKI